MVSKNSKTGWKQRSKKIKMEKKIKGIGPNPYRKLKTGWNRFCEWFIDIWLSVEIFIIKLWLEIREFFMELLFNIRWWLKWRKKRKEVILQE